MTTLTFVFSSDFQVHLQESVTSFTSVVIKQLLFLESFMCPATPPLFLAGLARVRLASAPYD